MFTIRRAAESDLAGIFEIYDREVLQGTATFETRVKTEQERLEWFNAHRRDKYPAIVAIEAAGGRVAGWAALSPWSVREAYARSAEDSVYVHPECQRRGIGRALMVELIARARAAGICVIVARIVEGNPPSRVLHEAMGFRTVGVMQRIGEKFGRILDVRVMDLHLDR